MPIRGGNSNESPPAESDPRGIRVGRALFLFWIALGIACLFAPPILARHFLAPALVQISKEQWKETFIPTIARANLGADVRRQGYADVILLRDDLVRIITADVVYAPGSDVADGTRDAPAAVEVLTSLRIWVVATSKCMDELQTASVAVRANGTSGDAEIFQESMKVLSRKSRCDPVQNYFSEFSNDKQVGDNITVHATILRKLTDVFGYVPDASVDAALAATDAHQDSPITRVLLNGILKRPSLGQAAAEDRNKRVKEPTDSFTLVVGVVYAALSLALLAPVFGSPRNSLFLKLSRFIEAPVSRS